MPAGKLTPMLQQYRNIKEQYPDVLLMFRLGDFYEMFGEDAEVASKELEIVLTSREVGKDGRMPMCGVPHHAVERYVARLISRGYRVAICDQMEDPRQAKGLVKRTVTRVVTPGTVLEDGMLDAKSNNFLVALIPAEEKCGLAVLDVSTGEFVVTETIGEQSLSSAVEEIARISPAECLIREIDQDLKMTLEQASGGSVTLIRDEGGFRLPSRQALLEHFGTASLRGFGCEEMDPALDAAAVTLDYLRKTNAPALQHVRTLGSYSTTEFMVLDSAARRNLELTRSLSLDGRGACLLDILDLTRTPMGGRLLRRWVDQPLLDVGHIRDRLDSVEFLFTNGMQRRNLRDALSKVSDLERLISRTVAGTANARDLVALRNSLDALPMLKAAVGECDVSRIGFLLGQIEDLPTVSGVVAAAIVEDPPISLRDGGIIREGFNDELDRLRRASVEGKDWIAGLENSERERTGIKSLKVGYNSVFGYYIEVTKPNLQLVPDDYIRKQTTANGERFITPQLKEYEALVLGADEKAIEMEYAIFSQVREEVAKHAETIATAARAVAELDVLASLAEVAANNGYCRPDVNDGEEIVIKNGRHPVVEQTQTDQRFVPNDAYLNCSTDQLLIITGPNMAGKSTYLRQVALIVLLAQMGSFVPADKAQIGVVDRIFTRVGAHDELTSGQSTFMVEMNETASILNNATRRSLIMLDEIGRGTSTFDGVSIAWAVAERINAIGAKTLFATHYHLLNDLEKQLSGVKNYRIAVKEDAERIIWLRKIMPGGTDKSYGIEVARLAGLPPEVIERSKEILKELESNGAGFRLGSGGEILARTQRVQLTLFEAETHPVVEELRKLDISTLSPIEALNWLHEAQKRASDG